MSTAGARSSAVDIRSHGASSAAADTEPVGYPKSKGLNRATPGAAGPADGGIADRYAADVNGSCNCARTL